MTNPNRGWFKRLDAIEFLGINETTWQHKIAPSLPPEVIRKENGKFVFVHGPSLIKFMMQQATEAVGDEAELLSGSMGAPPELITKKIKTQIKLMEQQIAIRSVDARTKEESVVDRNDVHEVFSRVAGFIRAGIDKLQKTFGSEAFDIMAEKIQDAEDYIKDRFGDFPASDSDRGEAFDPVNETAEDTSVS